MISVLDQIAQHKGEMAARIAAFDWGSTPLGPAVNWPQSLRSALSICLGASFPCALYWGETLTLVYNDAWSVIPAERHPAALGRPGAEVWYDIWDVVGPQFQGVLRTGEGLFAKDQLLLMERGGLPQETWWNYSMTPIRGEDGRVVGIFNMGTETTERVQGERRSALLLELADQMRAASGAVGVAAIGAQIIGEHLRADRVSYAEISEDGLRAVVGSDWSADGRASTAGTHNLADLGDGIVGALRAGEPVVIDDVAADPRTGPARALLEAYDIRSSVAIPLREGDRFAAVLSVQCAAPRHWFASEVALLREATERMWAAAERARVAEVAAESERRLALVLDSVSDGFYALDRNLRFTLFNAASERHLGRPRDEVLGRPLAEVFNDDWGRALTAHCEAVLRTREPRSFELPAPGRADTTLEMRAAPKAAGGVAVTLTDVTERRAQARAVEEARRLLDAVVDAMPAGVIIADRTGRIIRTNPANGLLWGIVPDTDRIDEYGEWRGWWPDTGERLQAKEWAMARALLHGEVVPGELVEIARFDTGEHRFMLNSAAPVRDQGGAIVAGIVAQIDVTDRIHAERALAEAVRVKDVLLHEVNHRVKNSLQVVSALLSLQISGAREPQLRSALSEARNRIAVVAAMHQRLYSTSEHDRVDFGEYMTDMATETLESLGATERITLSTDVAAGVVVLLNQAVPLALVVSELVTNAIKYAFPDDQPGTLHLALHREGAGMRIAIADDGVGLPADFDPQQASGLGMRIVTALIRQVRGALTIARQERGTRFEIVIADLAG